MKMDSNSEKRAFARRDWNASIEFSYFNRTHSYNASVVNVSAGGMCFQSHQFLQPGTTVYIRLKKFSSLDFPRGSEEGLRCMSLAQVKWCQEQPGLESGAYDVGVKYQAPVY